MAWEYCVRWNMLRATPIDPLTEDEARARHRSGALYTAYSRNDDGAVSMAVEVRLENGFVGVWDFDRYRRPCWYRVLKQRDGRMFMGDTFLYEYGDSVEYLAMDRAEQVLHRHVEPDGNGFTIERRKGDPIGERTEISLKEGEALDYYWIQVPAFGEYDEASLVGIDPSEIEQALREAGYEGA